jgi:hypothetical protein
MSSHRSGAVLWQGLALILLLSLTNGQVTETIKRSDIYEEPGNEDAVLGRVNSGTKVIKIGKDPSGKFIKATLEFYIPLDALEEGRVAKGIGEIQTAGQAGIRLVNASLKNEQVTVIVEITNNGQKDLDMSGLLLFKVVDGKGNIGNLEFMESVNSVGIIKPGQVLHSELVYKFSRPPNNLEMSFQSVMGGDKVFFLLGF